jgi:uncharacterized membrane protein
MNKAINLIRIYHKKITVVTVVFLFFLLRIWPMSRTDLLGDGAINSFRAFGWFDWLANSGQLTPFEWFGHIPNWALLSFHDAPPLSFFIQHIFFGMFGGGVVVARLPFILSGLGIILLLWFFLNKLSGKLTASVSVLFYSVMSYAVWAEQSVYLEGMVEFFIVCSVIFGGYFLFKKQSKKYLYLWFISIALALLTKYTALFILPPVFLYMYLHRTYIRENIKQVFISSIICLFILTPIIVYNAKLYQYRGHFDAALSSIVGMHPSDFSIISQRSVSFNVSVNLVSIIKTLANNISYSILILFIICTFILLFNARGKKLKSFESWVIVHLFFLIFMFSFATPGDRFLSIFVPFIALVIGLGIRDVFISTSVNKRYLVLIVVFLVFVFELVYSINTNVTRSPYGKVGWMYSPNKIYDIGFNKLDTYIRTTAVTKLPPKHTVRSKDDVIFSNEDVEGRSVVIFDDRINWFAQMWYMQRYFMYYGWPYISTSFLSQDGPYKLSVEELLGASGETLYFIYPISDQVMDLSRKVDASLNYVGPELAKQFDAAQASTTVINDSRGTPVFKIYKIQSHVK